MKNNNVQRKTLKILSISLLFFIILFSVALISATPLQEFLDSFDLEITIAQDNTTAEFNMDLSNTSFNQQDFTYEDFTIENIYISALLDGINFKARTEKGLNYTIFDEFKVELGTTPQFILDNAFSYANVDLTSEQINNNISLLNEFVQRHPAPYESDRTIILKKSGTDYNLFMNTGFESINESYREKIKEIIIESVYSVNVKSLLNKAIPLVDYDLSFLEELDLDYQVSIINLDELSIEDGTQEVLINIEHKTNITKSIILNLINIESEEVYVPEVSEVIEALEGLKFGTIVNITIIDGTVPKDTKAFKFLEITTNQNTSGKLIFKLNKSEVTNYNKVSLYVLEDDWVKLKTEFIGLVGDEYFFKSEIPHFSTFMIAEDTYVAPVEQKKSSDGRGGRRVYDEDKEEPINITFDCKGKTFECFGDFLYECTDEGWIKRKDCLYGCENGECKKGPIIIEPEKRKDLAWLWVVIGVVVVLAVIFGVIAKRKQEKDDNKKDEVETDIQKK